MVNRFIPICEPALLGKELEYVENAVSTGWISSKGTYIKAFERKFAEYCGAKYAIGACNGTVALHLALTALGVEDGDEVIIPDFTMIASAVAVCYTGAKPVFVDVKETTWNINPDLIRAKITSKTKAIMVVSVFGNPCDMNLIRRISENHNLKIIEDAAESHGAEYQGLKTGNLADITAFSFYANKNLTTGEGGMVVTNDEDLNKKCQYYRNLCFPINSHRNYLHKNIGFNYRLSNIHAAIGLAQVEKADLYREMRIKNHMLYEKYLSDAPGIIFQKTEKKSLSVHWMNCIVINPTKFGKTKHELVNYLKNNNIDTRSLFVGMHKQPSLKKYGCNCSDDYPVTDFLSENGFYLPSASTLTEYEISYICSKVKKCRGM